MVEELTVLLVGNGEPDPELCAQLERKQLQVEVSSIDEFPSLLGLVEPHLVIHLGHLGAERTAQILKDTEDVRRVRLVVIANRDELSDLRKLDRSVVVSLLATDIAASVVAARVQMLTKKGPEKSIRPPGVTTTTAQPPPVKLIPAPQREPGPALLQKPSPGPPSAVKPGPQLPVAGMTPPRAPTPQGGPPRRATSQPAPIPASPQAETHRPMADAPAPASIASAPPSSGSSGGPRVLLADNDMTRADFIACALRAKGVETRVVPLDAAATHWSLVRAYNPTIVLGDGVALKSTGNVWLQLLQADQALKHAKLVAVPFDRLFDMNDGLVKLQTLIPHIPQLSGELPKAPLSTRGPALPVVSAPSPVDDEESEFERMTVAQPANFLLPKEAAPSKTPNILLTSSTEDRETLVPPASELKAFGVKELDKLDLHDSEPPPGLFPLARDPFSNAADGATLRPAEPVLPAPIIIHAPAPLPRNLSPNVPLAAPVVQAPIAALQATGAAPKKLSKLLTAAVAIAGLGAGGWFVFEQRSASDEAAQKVAARAGAQALVSSGPSATKSPLQATLPLAAAEPAVDSLWVVPPTGAIPTCETAVPNLAELKSGGEQQANLSWSKARQALVLGDLDKALVSLCEAVLLQTDSLALEGLASVYVTKRAPEMAKKWHDLALAARPDRGKTIEVGGDIQSLLGNVTGARDAFAKSLGLDPHDQRTLNIIAANNIVDGEKQRRAGALAQAELFFRRAASLNPANADAAAGMASTFAALGDTAMSKRWAEHTLTLDGGHHVALVVLAAIATEAGDKDRATALCAQSIERNPNYLPAHQLLKSLKSE